MSKNEQMTPEEKLLAAILGKNHPDNLNSNVSKPEHDKRTGNSDYNAAWRALCQLNGTDKLPAALFEHFKILTDTDECESLMKDILDKVLKVAVVEERLVVTLKTVSGETGNLVCSAPAGERNKDYPEAYSDILSLHARFAFPEYGAAAFNSPLGAQVPVFLNGSASDTMFEPETPEEEEWLVVIDTFQDWFVLSPEILPSMNKPAVAFLSHGSTKTRMISRETSIGGHYLRLIGRTILGEDDSRVSLMNNL